MGVMMPADRAMAARENPSANWSLRSCGVVL